jgi:hypothetical protein
MPNIFIIGTGRSGTHLLCRTLKSFVAVTDFLGGIEDPSLLSATARAAIAEKPLSEAAIDTILGRSELAANSGNVYVDQTHPLLWFVETLHHLLPGSLFIFPWRPNEQILASMLRHEGVLHWYAQICNGTVDAAFPSRFFGIASVKEAGSLPLPELCLARIVSHKRECLRLHGLLGTSRIRIIDYEHLVRHPKEAVMSILTPEERNALGSASGHCTADGASLDKYMYDLTHAQIERARSLEMPHP